ncbi:MAG: hypothetical protein H6Q77_788 [Gemmatimonadetes bacterium]|nr:hypothetical protein [Gemmatimonadota bacterium]
MIDLSVPVASGFALLSALHLYWAAGGRAGAVAALPERNGAPLFQPGFASTLVVAGLLASAALLVLAHAGRWPAAVLPGWMVRLGVPVAAVALLARSIGDFRYVGFFKTVCDTRFARLDTRLYSPLALLLGVATGFVAWSTP